MESITASWLTERLHEAGHTGTPCAQIHATQIGTGQIGKCIRFELELDGDDPTRRARWSASFPRTIQRAGQPALRCKNYIKEVSFYQQMQRSG